MSAKSRQTSFDKYKSLNNYYTSKIDPNGLPLTGPLPTKYVRDANLVQEVLAKTGISNGNNYSINEIGNVQRVENGTGVGYRVNVDHTPLHYKRKIQAPEQTQNITVRYLEPPRPPTPGPIVIKERRPAAPAPAPPIVIRQIERAPPTPAPLLIREKPSTPPARIESTYVDRVLPTPPPPPRQVIIERVKAPPQKPRDVIYEKWLPYKAPSERKIIIEKAPEYRAPTAPKNIIIEYEHSHPSIKQKYTDAGIYKANPNEYSYDDSKSSYEIKYMDRINDLPDEYLYKYRSESARRSRSPTKMHEFVTINQRAPSATDIKISYDPIEDQKRPQTSVAKPQGPKYHYSPWNTTYRTSYTFKSVERS